MSKPKKNREKARQIKGLGNSGLKKNYSVFLAIWQEKGAIQTCAHALARIDPNIQVIL